MRKSLIACACVLALALPYAVSGERPPDIAGTWEVTTRMPDRALNETWTIQQKGATVTATASGARGEMPVSGTIAGSSFRVSVKDGNATYKVRATLDEDAKTMDGSITDAGGQEHPWHATRAKTR